MTFLDVLTNLPEGHWFGPVGLRPYQAYCLEGHYIRVVPGIHGASIALMPTKNELLGEWEHFTVQEFRNERI